jgi:GH43 family beta-xylosidase
MPLDNFRNPVHPRHFADPFVLRMPDAWYAYGTGPQGDAFLGRHGARLFEILRSVDFATWVSAGYALQPPALPGAEGNAADREFWAPEVVDIDGTFHLYYSTGIGVHGHHLRVAMAARPEGPFTDAGVNLTPHEAYAIHPHPHRDERGWHLFYARGTEAGGPTSLVVDRLVDPALLAGEARDLLPPDPGLTREAPFVRVHGGRSWCLHARGATAAREREIAVLVADDPAGPFRELDDDSSSVLRGIPGFRGPGQCSVTTGPDGDDWLAYHAWDDAWTEPRMCLDRLTWTVDGPRTGGPTAAPQPVPLPPDAAG